MLNHLITLLPVVTKRADHMPTKAVPPRKRVRKTQNINVHWPFLAAFSNILTIKEVKSGKN